MPASSLPTYDLVIQAGDDRDFVVTWLPDGEVPDLAGAAADMQVSWNKGLLADGSLVAAGGVSLASADDEIEFDTETGDVTVHLAAASTVLIPAISSCVYQLRVTTADNVKTTIASGRLTALRGLIDE